MDKNDLAQILYNKSFDELNDSQKKTVLNFVVKETRGWNTNKNMILTLVLLFK